MRSADLRKQYIEFFKTSPRNHVEIPPASLIPENDSTSLFTSSGMQPLIPYLLGQKHPMGKRLVNSQRSFRAADIDEVGDNSHTTFFEMLGNWSLGDYFKKEQLPWIWEFLTKELGLSEEKLFVTVFEGTKDVPRDGESADIWKNLGVTKDHIHYYGLEKNWWSRSGEPKNMPAGEPGGPDSEVFYDFGEELSLHEKSLFKNERCHPNCGCGRFMEIANSVFMQYQKEANGSLKELSQKNVDFGGGLERMVAVTENTPDVFKTDLFIPLIQRIEAASNTLYGSDVKKTQLMRIISDHTKAAVMMMSDGVLPSNKDRGSILRKLISRVITSIDKLNIKESVFKQVATEVITMYQNIYTNVYESKDEILHILGDEERRYRLKLEHGIPEFKSQQINKFSLDTDKDAQILIDYNVKAIHSDPKNFYSKLDSRTSLPSIAAGTAVFLGTATYGIPTEYGKDIVSNSNWKPKINNLNELNNANDVMKQLHQEASRSASSGMFKGGLADNSVQTTRLHTAHHLLLAALQKVVDPTIRQRGSNITVERLRMDFNFARKVTPEELKKVEKLVNEKIKEDLPVTRVEMPLVEAEKVGAQMEFGHKYPDRVSVYFVGPASPAGGSNDNFFSAEFCGGPHVGHTGEIGEFKILKEESAGSGIRRIYATVK